VSTRTYFRRSDPSTESTGAAPTSSVAQLHASLLRRVEDFIATNDLNATLFGKLAVNDGNFMRDLRSGRNMTLRRLECAEAFIRCDWDEAEPELDAAVDDELLSQASECIGLKNKSVVVREALKALIERESARRPAGRRGSKPELAIARQQPEPT